MNIRKGAAFLWKEWVRPLALPLLCVAAAKSALADINYVPTGSMHPTLLDGDVVVVNKLAYDFRVPFTFARLAHWSDPARGDIVVCFKPTDGMRLVKRVVAVPGDTVEMRNEVVFLNGQRLAYTPAALDAGAALPEDERATALLAREQLGTHAHVVEVLPGRAALRNFGPVTVPADSTS